MNTVNLRKFKDIIDTVRELDFENFYQAGTPSKIHELNLVVIDKSNNRQYWICKSFGQFHVSYRNSITNVRLDPIRIECKNQKDVCIKFKNIVNSFTN